MAYPLNDQCVTKTRGCYRSPKKVQVKSSMLQKSDVRKRIDEDIELKFTPLVPTPTTATVMRKPTTQNLLRTEGYALNRTQSTGGIAAKVSLELKKKYLLGESTVPGNIQKSGSVSTLDSKFKSFHSNITDCQKLLKPAPEISASMKTFCSKLDERTSPISPTLLSQSPTFFSNTKTIEQTEKVSIKPEEELPNKIETFENETEGRPRSPVHETSIIVPDINWQEKKEKKLDSLEDTSSTESSSEEENKSKSIFANIPRLEVYDDAGVALNDEEAPFDSLNSPCEHISEAPKSISNERKTLNQPKPVPTVLESDSILAEVHKHSHAQQQDNRSARSTPSPVNDSCADQATAALTETELSDWARDETVSDDYEDVDVVFNKDKVKNECINIAKIQELEDIDLKKVEITECVNNILNPTNLDNIEFMDNNTGTSSDDDNGNNGYVQFENEEEELMDSLNPVIETKNPILTNDNQNNENNGPEVHKKIETQEEDSLLILDAGTTTEENTCSDSTVKNVTEKFTHTNETCQMVKELRNSNVTQNTEYEEHCQRLASKVEFGNVKDSIDIRKSKRRKSDQQQQPIPDLIQEEKEQLPKQNMSKLYKKEEIEKERDKNQKLIQEMVMNKMKAQNKSLERKKRIKGSFSPIRPYDLAKSATTDLSINMKNNYNEKAPINKIPPPDLITIIPIQKSQTLSNFGNTIEQKPTRPLSAHVTKFNTLNIANNADSSSLPNVNQSEASRPQEEQKHKRRSKENIYIEDSIESLVLNTERRNSLLYSNDTLSKKRNNSFRRCKSGEETYRLDIPQRKSVPDFGQFRLSSVETTATSSSTNQFHHKSDPNLLNGIADGKKDKRKVKDNERRKSFTKFISDIFTKKKENASSTNKSLFSMISPKTKEKSKVMDLYD